MEAPKPKPKKKKVVKPAKPLTPMQQAIKTTRGALNQESQRLDQEAKKEQQMAANVQKTRAAAAKLEAKNALYPNFVNIEEETELQRRKIAHEPLAVVKASYAKLQQ